MIVKTNPDEYPKLLPCLPAKGTRPYRDKEVYAAFCLGCGREIESDTPNVPMRCATCKREGK